jgi:hypothetical protein
LAHILTFYDSIWHLTWHKIWHFIRHSIWHIFWQSIWYLDLFGFLNAA